jgi:hypothetical protein
MTMALPVNHPFNEVRIGCHSPSVGGTPIAAYTLAPCRGRIIKVGCVINAAITGADCSVAVAINGVAVTGSPFTITQAGSAAGTSGTMTPTGANTVNEDDYISFTPSGATGTTVTGTFFAIVQKA